MKISALVFDLDGTAIPQKPDGLPSSEVIAAIEKFILNTQTQTSPQ